MSKSKNQLAENIPSKSTVNDIETELSAASIVTNEFMVEFEDATASTLDENKYDLPIGRQKTRALSIEEYTERHFTSKKGEDFKIDPCYEIEIENIVTHDKTILQVFKKQGSMDSFKNGVNRRSNGDLGSKIGNHEVTELTVTSVARYWAKYPIEINYDFTEWIEEDGTVVRSKRPKVQLWYPEDFKKPEPKHKIVF